MGNDFYLLIYPINRPTLQLNGLKKKIIDSDGARFVEIHLNKYCNMKMNDIEYSSFFVKMFKRILNQKQIFRTLEELIDNNVSIIEKGTNIYLCIADEGVWGEFVKLKAEKLRNNWNVTTINVQHGLFYLTKTRFLSLRKTANFIFIAITDYPIVGMNFGGSNFNIYYVYSEKEKRFVLSRSRDSRVIISPEICLFDVLNKIQSKKSNNKNKTVLFAMQHLWVRNDVIYSEENLYKKIFPILKEIKNNYRFNILFRLHPGTPDKDKSVRLLKQAGIYDIVELDKKASIVDALASSSVVISFSSTVLVYAQHCEKLPLLISGVLKKEIEFPSHHKEISLTNWETDIKNIFSTLI